MKKPAAKKEVFFIKRVMVTETIIEVEAVDEAEAVQLVMAGKGAEIGETAYAHVCVDGE